MSCFVNLSTLERMKTVFMAFSKSEFRFPKFHLTTHYLEDIEKYGSLHIVSSAHGERTHKTDIKPAHGRTSRKKRTSQGELIEQLQMQEELSSLSKAFDVELPRAAKNILNPGADLGAHAFVGKHLQLDDLAAEHVPGPR